jgi:two-component system, OmpR family, alkaline phosphatase synthesis response regulator PhoP
MGLTRVVVAEDDASIRELVVHHLRREGFRWDEAADGAAALRHARSGADVLILDVGLPMIDGFEIVRTLRREGRQLPILVLTARTEEIDRVVGLEIGADDYVTKPFSPRELVARVKALGRRAGLAAATSPVLLTFDRLEIDEAAREARVDGVDVGLKPREFALLLELATNPGIALSRAMLLEKVWGFDFEGDERTVDVHVRRLRLKLEERARLPLLLQTIHGFGYKFIRAPAARRVRAAPRRRP